MADIRGNEGVNFGGKRGVNASDPRQDKDVVNFRTLKVHIASISGSTSTGSTSVSVSSIGDGYPVYAGLNAGTYEFRSFSAGTPNLQMYCGNTITYSLNDNLNIVGLTASTITANTVNSGQFLSAGTPIEFYLKERIWTGSTGVNSTIRNNGTGNLAAGQASFVAGSNSKAYGVYSTVLNGASNISNGNYALIVNGANNNIQTSSQFSTVLNGAGNVIQSNAYFNSILNGTLNTINSLSSYSSILGGNFNTLIGINSSIVNSKSGYLSGNYSSILGGSSNAVYGNYSSILGGFALTVFASNTVAVPYLRITNAPNGGIYMLTIDNSGYVFKQSIPVSGATNIGGTHGIFSNINLGIIRFKSLSGGSNIIITSSSTENAISLSSNVVTSSISATTVSGGTFYSGQTPLGTIIISEASRYWTGSTGTKAMVANNQTGNIASGTYSIAAGRNNKSYGTVSTIIGGRYITLYESYSFAGSGHDSKAKSKYNFLGSGRLNNIYTNSLYGSIINGRGHKLTGHSATIINGYGHNINIPYIGTPQYLAGATIAGGRFNQILFKGQSFIGAGAYNKISGDSSLRSFIGAGTNNIIYNTRSFIGAGYGNKIFAAHSSMLSSINSKIYASSSSVIAAGSSTLSGVSVGRSIIIGGISQNLVGDYSMIGVGLSNHIKFSNHTIVLAGQSNTAETISSFSLIAQGKNNRVKQSTFSSIFNGISNTADTSSFIIIGSGAYNNVRGNSNTSSIHNGSYNFINAGTKSTIKNGIRNGITAGVLSSILNGSGNTMISSTMGLIGNGKSNYVSATYSSVLNGFLNRSTGTFGVTLNGIGNASSGSFSIVGNGSGNTSSGSYATVLNGYGHLTNSLFALIGNGKEHRFINAPYGTIINGSGNTIQNSSNFSFIGNGKLNTAYGIHTIVLGGTQNNSTGTYALVLNGSGNTAVTPRSTIINGKSNRISNTANYTTIISGKYNLIFANNNSFIGVGSTNTIIGGFFGFGQYNSIVNGVGNYMSYGSNNSILNSTGSTVTVGKWSSVLAGINHLLYLATASTIVAGSFNTINGVSGTSILAGSAISAISGDTAYAKHLAVVSNATLLKFAGGGTQYLTVDNNGAVGVSAGTGGGGGGGSTVNNGINTFTAGTSSFQSVNVTDLSINTLNVSGISVFTGTLSGGSSFSASTIYSGSTNLYSIFAGIGSVGSGTQTSVQSGLNTYTGGTSTNPTVNVSALTINTLTASGNSVFTGTLSGGSSFSASTIYSGSTDLSLLITASGNLLWNTINTKTLQNTTVTGNPYFLGNNSLLFGNNNTSNIYGNKSVVFGNLNYIGSPYAFVAGQNNYIAPFINNSTVLGGIQNKIVNYSAMYTTKYQSILGGSYNKINSSHKSTILGGHANYICGFQYSSGVYSSILGGVSNGVYKGINNTIIGGKLNKISQFNGTVTNTVYSTIINGLNNQISDAIKYSTIIGGKNYTLNESYTVLVPKLKIANLPSASGSYMLVANSSGNIYKTTLPSGISTSIQPGTNTYTGGTSTNPTVNVSALTISTLTASGNSVFTGTLSGGSSFSASTIYSGSTDLYSIFTPIGSNIPTYVQPGLNTYTGGTSTSPTVNVSALTINTIVASGDSRFTTLSATTLTANTITASTISANTLYVYGSLNQTQQTYLSTVFSTTSASLTDVTGMSFTIQPFEVWQFHISGQMSGSTANGQNHGLSIPTNAVLRANDTSNTNSVTAFRTSILNTNNAESSTVCAAANNVMGFEIKGTISGSSTSGTVQLRLRANTAGNTESIQDGAYLIAQRIR